jgi:hypothetical protein
MEWGFCDLTACPAARSVDSGYSKCGAGLLKRGERFLGNDEEETIRVVVVDDQRLFSRGLSGLVDMLPGLEVVA